jgi:hypothetical protein
MHRAKLIPALILCLAIAACGRDRVVLYVGPETATCTGVGVRQCLLVREDPDEDWHFFYDSIRGFEFEPGYYYTLLVERRRVSPVAADESSLRWSLVRILSKVPAEETM